MNVELTTNNFNGVQIKIEIGHEIKEWKDKYQDNWNVWSFSIEDILAGAIELNEDTIYWYINGRLYETK